MELQLIKNIIASRAIGLRPLAVPVRGYLGRFFLVGEDGYVAGEGSDFCSLYIFPIPRLPTSTLEGQFITGPVEIKREGNMFIYIFEGHMNYIYFPYRIVRAVDVLFSIKIKKLDDGNVEIVNQTAQQNSYNYYFFGQLYQYYIKDFRDYIPLKVIDSDYLIPLHTINTCFKTGDSDYIDEQQQIITYIGHIEQGKIFKENGKWYFSTPDLNIFIDYPKNIYIGYRTKEIYEI